MDEPDEAEALESLSTLAGHTAVGCECRAEEHLRAARAWEVAQLSLALLAAVLAAVSGSALVADGDAQLGAGLALAAAIVAGALTALSPGKAADRHKRGADGFGALRTRFREFRGVSMNAPGRTVGDLRAELDRLFARRDQLAEQVPTVPAWAQKKEEEKRRKVEQKMRGGHQGADEPSSTTRASGAQPLRHMQETRRTFEDELPYLLFTPQLARDRDESLPLIIFLHGSDEVGGSELSARTLDNLLATGLPKLCHEDRLPLVRGINFPFLVAAPQSSGVGESGGLNTWNVHYERILGLVEGLIASENADPTRCYVTGISRGAWAVWEIAASESSPFVGLVPVSGDDIPQPFASKAVGRASAWVFNGEHELGGVPDAVNVLRRQGGEVNLTVVPGAGHDQRVWDDIYAQPDLYDWLLARRRDGQQW